MNVQAMDSVQRCSYALEDATMWKPLLKDIGVESKHTDYCCEFSLCRWCHTHTLSVQTRGWRSLTSTTCFDFGWVRTSDNMAGAESLLSVELHGKQYFQAEDHILAREIGATIKDYRRHELFIPKTTVRGNTRAQWFFFLR